MTMKKFFVGAKAIIHDIDRGALIIKHERGYWDIPGGRLDDDEDLEDALARELGEELPNCKLKSIGEQVGAFRVHKDIEEGTSLVLVYYVVDVEAPEMIELSHEHTEYMWVKSEQDFPVPMDVSLNKMLCKVLKTQF